MAHSGLEPEASTTHWLWPCRTLRFYVPVTSKSRPWLNRRLNPPQSQTAKSSLRLTAPLDLRQTIPGDAILQSHHDPGDKVAVRLAVKVAVRRQPRAEACERTATLSRRKKRAVR